MTVEEFYNTIEENYNEVLKRLMVESRIKKYVIKIADDKNFELLTSSLDDKNYDEAFRAIHTIKGMALNLGFEKLYTASCGLTEKLRAKETDHIDWLYEDVEKEYRKVLEAIELIDR